MASRRLKQDERQVLQNEYQRWNEKLNPLKACNQENDKEYLVQSSLALEQIRAALVLAGMMLLVATGLLVGEHALFRLSKFAVVKLYNARWQAWMKGRRGQRQKRPERHSTEKIVENIRHQIGQLPVEERELVIKRVIEVFAI